MLAQKEGCKKKVWVEGSTMNDENLDTAIQLGKQYKISQLE
ncbi:hypothetical protein ACPRNU_24925 [Chromobacterium vaccinii]